MKSNRSQKREGITFFVVSTIFDSFEVSNDIAMIIFLMLKKNSLMMPTIMVKRMMKMMLTTLMKIMMMMMVMMVMMMIIMMMTTLMTMKVAFLTLFSGRGALCDPRPNGESTQQHQQVDQ